jgi:hypothetical protein
MRSANVVLLLVGLFAGVGLCAQTKENKKTFKTQIYIGGDVEGTFTVSERGYAWASTNGHYHSNGLTPWKDVRRWSCTGERDGFALVVHHQTGVNTFRFRHDDLVTIVDNYFKKYAGDRVEACEPD